MEKQSEEYNLQEITDTFEIDGSFIRGYSYGNGHINDTFCIETNGRTVSKYILQRLNGNVFKEPEKLMENVYRVTCHLRGKLSLRGKDPDRYGLTLIPQKHGGHWLVDSEGSVWRLYIFITDTVAYDIVDSREVARQGGLAFGEFQNLLADLPGDPLSETIPDFHDMEKRLVTFFEVADRDIERRAEKAAAEIDFVRQRAEDMSVFQRLGREGKLDKRITHNDTKINNVLMDSNDGSAVCVIDLDTVMPGYVMFDFGDSIRTATNTGAEDDIDLSRVTCDLELFKGYTNGYIASAGEFLSETETSLLAVSGRVMTFIIGLRFITDFLNGDTYFRIHRPGHNLDRARAQFKLLSSMEEKAAEMEEIVMKAGADSNG